MTIDEVLSAALIETTEARRIAVPLAGPFRVKTEDWLLRNVLHDFDRAGRLGAVVLVREQSRQSNRGRFVGVSVWRKIQKV